jgi:hypothetical protein
MRLADAYRESPGGLNRAELTEAAVRLARWTELQIESGDSRSDERQQGTDFPRLLDVGVSGYEDLCRQHRLIRRVGPEADSG